MEQNPEIREETIPVEEPPIEETPVEEIPEEPIPEEKSAYVPRPMWQVWAARVGLVLFIILLIAYYTTMFRGGR